MSELPAGWVETTLSEIVTLGPKSNWDDETQVGFVPMSYAPTNFRDALQYEARAWREVKKAYTHFENGDVIFAKVTPCFENGKAALVSSLPNGAGAGSSEFHVLRPASPDISASYLLAVIKGSQFLREGEENMTGAVGLRRVPRAFVEQFPVCLPPAAEQKRIAQKLDALLAQVDTLKARIDAIPDLLRRFRQATIAAAISGRLTQDFAERSCLADELLARLKGDHEAAGGHARGNASQPVEEAHDLSQEQLPSHWRVVELRDLCEPGRPITYGILKPGPELDAGVPYIRVADFPRNRLNEATIKKTSAEIDHAYRRARLKENDLLLSIRGSVGRIIKIPATLEGANITQDTARLSISNRVLPDYVLLALRSEDAQRRMRAATKGVAVRGINIGDVRALQIPLPGTDEQSEIVRRAAQLFAYADQLEAKIAEAQTRIDALTQSLLAKAFRGELVPQDPNDEPASVLLERIRAQRAATPKPKRGRKAATS